MDILNKTKIQNKILRAPEFDGKTGEGGASSTSSNAIFIGGVKVDKFYLGNSDDVKIYLGDTLLYPTVPSYKSELSYLQKDESHLGEVDLGLPITSNFKVEIKFRYISSGGSQFFGETPQTSSDNNDFRFFWSNSKIYFDFNDKRISGSRITYLSTGDTTSADQVFEFGNYYFNNITKDKHVNASYTLGASGRNNFCAFRQTGRDYGKIYYIKIYNGSTLVGDFIPVISNDNKYTFYNKITNTICTVIGTLTGA